MKKEDLKLRLIKDEQVFDNIQMEQAGLMGSGGCGGCGCGGSVNATLRASIRGTASLGGYSWNYTGEVDLYTIINTIPASGSDVRYSIITSVAATIQLAGTSSCYTDSEGKKTYTGGNSVTATMTFSEIDNCLPFDVSGSLGTCHFTVGKSTYDKEGKLIDSKTLLNQRANVVITISTIDYDFSSNILKHKEPTISLIPTS